MKKFTALFFSLLIVSTIYAGDWIKLQSDQASPAKMELKASTNNSATIHFSMNGFWQSEVLTSEGTALLLSVEKGASNLKKGAPNLPHFTTSIVIPDQAGMKIKVISSRYKDFSGVNIAPSKGNLLRTVDPSAIPYEYGKQYSTDAFYPGNIALLNEPYIVRDLRGQTIVVQPFQYNPVSKVLRVYYELEIQVFEDGNSSVNAIQRAKPIEKIDSRFNDIYAQHFLNYNMEDYTPVEEFGNMLIISHADFMDEIQPYADWKIKTGIPVDVVDVASIGNATAIKNYIKNYYTLHGLTFVLLVGDSQQVPSSVVSGNDSDVDYSYAAGNDHYPDLFVGRFSAETEAHVITQVERTLNYEMNPIADTSWYRKAIGIASSEGPGDDNEIDYQHIRNIGNNKLIPFTYNYAYELFDGSQGGNDASGNPTPAMVATAVNDGATIINYTGHGSQNSWSSSGFSSNNINTSLTNVGKLPFIISVACVNGDFVNATCFAEAWMRKEHNGFPAGAVATLMSTINQSWNPPMCGQDAMNDILVETFENNIKRTFGGITMNGCMQMNDDYGSDGDEMTDTWTIFGDPSLVVRTFIPQEMTVSFEPSIYVGSNSFEINCDAEGGIVALSMNGEVLGTGIVSGGTATIEFDEMTQPGTVDVVVTAFNYTPFIGTVEVVSAAGPYVTYAESFVVDSSGNNNGMLDYGEEVTLTLGLTNIGVDTAFAVMAGIYTSSEYITMLTDNANFGNIAEGDTVYAVEGFAFSVSNNVPDGEKISFLLTAEDQASRASWESGFSIVAHAPVLSYVDYSLDDSQGNNDGKLDAGEAATIFINVANFGTSSAYNIIGQLSTESEYLAVLTDPQELGNLEGQEFGQLAFDVLADGDTPEGQSVSLTISLVADNGISGMGEFYTIIGQKPVLIINMTSKSALVDTLQACFTELQVGVETATSVPENLDIYRSAFVLLGVYPNNHALTAEEGTALADFLQNGGRLYMEGGDTWVYDEQTDVHPMFHITGLNDGSDDLSSVVGEASSFVNGFNFMYDGDNNYLDQIEAQEESMLLFSNLTPYYGVAVAYENEMYKTIGSSFEFSGLTDQPYSTKDGYMATILNFFDITYTWTGIGNNREMEADVKIFPNPFSQQTNIAIVLEKSEFVSVEIYDLTGRKVQTLNQRELSAGNYQFNWTGQVSGNSTAPAGIYYCKVTIGNKAVTKKLVFTK
ncbi:MAG TPA: C25 family cysteine peptidase [Bacteroidales bacterium]